MAIRFEPPRDDNGQWCVGAAGSLYQSSGSGVQRLPMSDTLDLHFTGEMSDQDERRTSSCSPDSCEFTGNDRVSPYKSLPTFSPQLPHAANNYFFENASDYNKRLASASLRNWTQSVNLSKEMQYCAPSLRLNSPSELFTSLPYSERANVTQLHKNAKADAKGSDHPAVVRIPSYAAPGYKSSDIFSVAEPADLTTGRNSRQNGRRRSSIERSSAEQRCRSTQKTTNISDLSHRTAEEHSVIDDDRTIPLHKVAVNDNSSAVRNTEHLERTPKLDRFGENEAAEALLGLREVFFQPGNADNTGKSCSKQSCSAGSAIVENSTTALQDALLLKEDKQRSCSVSSDVTNPCDDEANISRASSFHFKKRICQKFVQSLGREKICAQPQASRPTPEDTVNLSSSNSQNGGSCLPLHLVLCENIRERKEGKPTQDPVFVQNDGVREGKSEIIDEALTDNNRLNDDPPPPTFRDSDKKKFAHRSSSRKSKQSSRKSTKTAKTHGRVERDAKRKTSNALKASVDCPQNSPVKQSKVVPMQNNLDRKDLNEVVDTGESNLYRVSLSLGSSSESLAASDNERVNASDTDSSTLSTDLESNDNDPVDPKGDVSQQSPNKTFKILEPATKRKAFVLTKPKFELPLYPKNVKLLSSNHTLHGAADKCSFGKTGMDYMKVSTPYQSFSTLKLKRSRHLNENNDGMSDSVKQNSIHIKKATFTFTGFGKSDKLSPLSGLSLTSKTSASLDRTRGALQGKNSICFDKDKLNSSGSSKAEQSNETQTNHAITFGTIRKGDSFEKLSNPTSTSNEPSAKNKDIRDKGIGPSKSKSSPFSYDKYRLPRSSARSAALEAHRLMKVKQGRKRKLQLPKATTKANTTSLQKKSASKRSKHEQEKSKRPSPSSSALIHEKKIGFNGLSFPGEKKLGSVSSANISSGSLGLEKSASRRKPARVYKHQKYSTVSMMSSSHAPRDLSMSTEFAIIRKPLNLDHRLLLASSLDCHSPNNFSVDNISSQPATSSSCSSRASSVVGDEDETGTDPSDQMSLDASKHGTKKHGHRTAVENEDKSELLSKKLRMRRLLSLNDQNAGRPGSGLMGTSIFNSSSWIKRASVSTTRSSFQLYSLFPAPPSLRAGHAFGELLPGYGPSVSGHRSTLPLRWKKGVDVRELKQKRQRLTWKKMTLDMFCMGQK